MPASAHRQARRGCGWLVLGCLLALTLAGTQARAQSGEHGDGHAEMHGTYEQWHPPGNPHTSCCNDADCRPTRAYMGDDGDWRAWNGNLWLRIPHERVLPTDFAGDGRSHLCENAGVIYCFTPGQIRG